MSNILRNTTENFKLKMVGCNYYDFMLSNDNMKCYNCNTLTTGDAVAIIDFTNVSGVCSSVTWKDATPFYGELCDIGLTGYDNRYVWNLTGEIFAPSGDTRFCMHAVSGDNFCYPIFNSPSGDTQPILNPYVDLCGGFYQGFYKLHEYDYQTLPNEYPQGWTMELWANKHDCRNDLSGVCDTYILNDLYPQNKGFIYYWGARAENKFCNFFPEEMGKETCTGVPLSPEYTISISGGTEEDKNSFLYWDSKRACKDLNEKEVASFEDCCSNLTDNAFGLRITDDGELNIRYLTTSGECILSSGSPIPSYSGYTIVENIYSDKGIINDNEWHLITLRFDYYCKGNECSKCRNSKGKLSIFVDGFLKMTVHNFKTFIPYPLDEHRDKQLSVPYNISVGGGTQGLLESLTFSGDSIGIDNGYGSDGFEMCDYIIQIPSTYILSGITLDGVDYDGVPLTTKESNLIEAFFDMVIQNRLGDVVVHKIPFCDEILLRIEIFGVVSNLQSIYDVNGCRINFCKNRCVTMLPHLGQCGILEENFAGSFIGSISQFRLHNKALCFNEIQCNFKQDAPKYGKQNFKPVCK